MNSQSASDETKPRAVGRTIGQYRIVEHLGAGGMGEVYLAEDSRTQRRVALKLLPDLFTEDEIRVRRFQQEARAILALNHPNIVTIYEIGQDKRAHFIVTELVEGETLRSRIKTGPLPLKDALDVALQVLKALTAAHEAGIIHRDIKPENIMIRRDGYVKVLDFGLAKLVEKTVSGDHVDTKAATVMRVSTDTGVVMGTVDYMSPEQARAKAVDQRTDVWSVGVVLYEMVTGRRPFEGETKTDVIAALLEHEPPPLARYLPEVPAELQRIIAKALSKDKEERYQTVKDLLIDLKNLGRALDLEAELKRSIHSTGGSSSPTVIMSAQEERTTGDTGGAAAASTGVVPQAAQTSGTEYLIGNIKRHKVGIAAALLLFVLIIAGMVIVAVVRFAWNKPAQTTAAPFSRVKVTRLTATGKASAAAISPDGKYVVHVLGARGQQSLWLRHIATGSDKEIVSSNGDDLNNLTFSHDGSFIYFTRSENGANALYQVAVLGGTPRKLASADVDTAISLSPDEKHYTFFRGDPAKGEGYIIVANADGTGERTIFTGEIRDFYIPAAGPSWSPDGEWVAFGYRTRTDTEARANVMMVRVGDGTKRVVTSQKWSYMSGLEWLRDGTGFIVIAAEQEAGSARQLWYVSYPKGEVHRITNDLNNYQSVSLTGDFSSLVTVETERVSNVWMMQGTDASRAAQVTSNRFDATEGLTWTPDGRILYTSRESGNSDIWMINADGSGKRQLTIDAGSNVRPTVSPDGRFIAFSSNRTGRYHIWRMDIDGGNAKELTSGQLDQRPRFTVDGKWILYNSNDAGAQRLWKVPVDGGSAVSLTDLNAANGVPSPDGKQIIFGFIDEQVTPRRWRYALIPIGGGRPTRVFDFNRYYTQTIEWSLDSRDLTYLDVRGGVSNIWSQPVDGGQTKQLTNFNSDIIFTYAWSQDHARLALARGTETSDVVLITDLK